MGALWGGPTSQAYKDWCAYADKKWERVRPELQAHAAQDQYERRVHGEIVRCLRQGTMPKELEAYIENARDAGHQDYADRLDLMARAMAALGAKIRGVDGKQEAAGKKKLGIDPAWLAEARIFAGAIRGAQDADAAKQTEKEKRGIDPARLAEARGFAQSIQDAKDVKNARVERGFRL